MARKSNFIPWYIRLVTIVGAWFATLLLIGFLAISRIVTEEAGALTIGTIFMTASCFFSRSSIRNIMIDPLIVALAFTGQIMFAIGFFGVTENLRAVYASGLLLELALLVSVKSVTQRFISVVLFFLCALGVVWNSPFAELTQLLIGSSGALLLIVLYKESYLVALGDTARSYFYPLMTGLVFSLASLTLLSIHNKWFDVEITHWWVSFILLLACTVFLLWTALYKKLGVSRKNTILLCAGLTVLLSPTAQTPGVIASIFIVALGFAFTTRSLLILGSIFFAVFITAFYYSIQISLLNKSYVLLSTGILFLCAYWFLAKRFKEWKPEPC